MAIAITAVLAALLAPLAIYFLGKMLPPDRHAQQAPPTNEELREVKRLEEWSVPVLFASGALLAAVTYYIFPAIKRVIYTNGHATQIFPGDIFSAMVPFLSYVFLGTNISLLAFRLYFGRKKLDRLFYLSEIKRGISYRKYSSLCYVLGTPLYVVPLIFYMGWRAEIKDDTFVYKDLLALQPNAQPLMAIKEITKVGIDLTSSSGEKHTRFYHVVLFQDGHCWSSDSFRGEVRRSDAFFAVLARASAKEIRQRNDHPMECQN